MAYTTAQRDHVVFVQSDGTAGGVTVGGGTTDAQRRIRTIRWIPAANADTITIDRVKEDLTTETVWESTAGGSTLTEESRIDLRLTRGFKVVMSSGGKLYLYEALDGVIAR